MHNFESLQSSKSPENNYGHRKMYSKNPVAEAKEPRTNFLPNNIHRKSLLNFKSSPRQQHNGSAKANKSSAFLTNSLGHSLNFFGNTNIKNQEIPKKQVIVNNETIDSKEEQKDESILAKSKNKNETSENIPETDEKQLVSIQDALIFL